MAGIERVDITEFMRTMVTHCDNTREWVAPAQMESWGTRMIDVWKYVTPGSSDVHYVAVTSEPDIDGQEEERRLTVRVFHLYDTGRRPRARRSSQINAVTGPHATPEFDGMEMRAYANRDDAVMDAELYILNQ